MKKTQRILAIAGIVLLAGLYLSTLVLALMGKDFFPIFMAGIFCTFVLPILIWMAGFLYKGRKDRLSESMGEDRK